MAQSPKLTETGNSSTIKSFPNLSIRLRVTAVTSEDLHKLLGEYNSWVEGIRSSNPEGNQDEAGPFIIEHSITEMFDPDKFDKFIEEEKDKVQK